MIDGDLMTIIERKLKYNTMNKLELKTTCIPIIVAIKQFLLHNEEIRNELLENLHPNKIHCLSLRNKRKIEYDNTL